MTKIFVAAVLTVCVGLVFASAADILQTVYAQLRLPPEEVQILNKTATNNTIPSSTNSTTEIDSVNP
jgi:hypothetical protein